MLVLWFLSAYSNAYRFHGECASRDLSAPVFEADFSIISFVRYLWPLLCDISGSFDLTSNHLLALIFDSKL